MSVALGFACFGVIIGIWALLSYTGLALSLGFANLHNPFFLPSPGTVTKTLYDMFAHEGFAHDVWASTRRIMIGFLLSTAIGIPLGIAIGSFRVVQAFFEPFIAAVRYMPASWPGVLDNMRIGIGWAWTYLIVAELVAASTGIGHVILSASRFLRTDEIIAGIITIGILGLLTDALFRWLYWMLFPYSERVAR